MLYTIYMTTNKINGKVYIGKHQTEDVNDNYLGSGKYLKRAIAKHGVENFEKEVLFVFDNEAEMNAKEAELVTEDFVKQQSNYNLCPGGQGGFGHVNSNGLNLYGRNGKTPNVKDNLARGRETAKRRWETDPDWAKAASEKRSTNMKNFIEVNGSNWLGRNHTEETKQKIGEQNSINQKGERNSQYGKRWIHSLELKKSMKIDKTEPLPAGWKEGRVIKF